MVEAMEIQEGYKQTEVGVIPSDWEVKKLADLVDKFVNGGTPSTQIPEYWNGNIPWITGADILNQKVAVIRRYISKEAVKNSLTNIIEKENILIVSRTGVGKLAIAPFAIAISQDFTGVYVKSSELDTVYLFRYFDFVQKELKTQNQGTSIQGITRETLSSIKIPFPPNKAEQTAIATVLNDADALITQLEKLIAKKRAIKQGAMQELLKPKDGWELKKLGDFIDYEQPTKYLVSDTEYNDHNQTPVLTAGKTFILGYTNEEFGIFNNLPVIIFDDFTTASKFVDFQFKAKSSAMKILKPKKDVNLKFVFELIQTIKFDSTDHKRYWISEYQNIEAKVPKQDEQTRIAQILSDMDVEIEALEKKLEKYKMIKQGMMQNLLTGKIRLI